METETFPSGALGEMRIVRQPDERWAVISLVEKRWRLTDASKHALHEFIKALSIERMSGDVGVGATIQCAWDECERITKAILKSGCADGVDTLSYQTACNLVREGDGNERTQERGEDTKDAADKRRAE